VAPRCERLARANDFACVGHRVSERPCHLASRDTSSGREYGPYDVTTFEIFRRREKPPMPFALTKAASIAVDRHRTFG
jgi:hypothetical protein